MTDGLSIAGIIGGAITVAGSIAIAVVRRGEKRDVHATKVATTNAREDTARRRIEDGAHARESHRVDELHAQLEAKNAELVAKAAAEAACLEGRKADAELRRADRKLIRWLWKRMDDRDGKQSMPPFALTEPFEDDLEPEPAE